MFLHVVCILCICLIALYDKPYIHRCTRNYTILLAGKECAVFRILAREQHREYYYHIYANTRKMSEKMELHLLEHRRRVPAVFELIPRESCNGSRVLGRDRVIAHPHRPKNRRYLNPERRNKSPRSASPHGTKNPR